MFSLFGLNTILDAFPDARAIRDFNRSLFESHSAQQLVDKMMAVHGGLGNPYTLWTAAQAMFQQAQVAAS